MQRQIGGTRKIVYNIPADEGWEGESRIGEFRTAYDYGDLIGEWVTAAYE